MIAIMNVLISTLCILCPLLFSSIPLLYAILTVRIATLTVLRVLDLIEMPSITLGNRRVPRFC